MTFLAAATASSKRPRPMNAAPIPVNAEKGDGSNGLSRLVRALGYSRLDVIRLLHVINDLSRCPT
jgi:hypothetical protein